LLRARPCPSLRPVLPMVPKRQLPVAKATASDHRKRCRRTASAVVGPVSDM